MVEERRRKREDRVPYMVQQQGQFVVLAILSPHEVNEYNSNTHFGSLYDPTAALFVVLAILSPQEVNENSIQTHPNKWCQNRHVMSTTKCQEIDVDT